MTLERGAADRLLLDLQRDFLDAGPDATRPRPSVNARPFLMREGFITHRVS